MVSISDHYYATVFTDCQCIFNPSISVWTKNGTLGDIFPFNIEEEHDNEIHAFVSHIISPFQFGKCSDSSVEKHLYRRFAS